MRKILIIILCFISVQSFGQNRFQAKNIFNDSVYFLTVPYSASAGIVHLGIDTVAASPTFGKLVRKTASASTPTLQQVLDAGSTLTSSETIDVGGNTLNLTGSGFAYNITGGAVAGQITGSGKAALLDVSSATTNTIDRPIALRSYTSGTAAAGYGTGIEFLAERGNGNLTSVGYLDYKYTDVGNTTYTTQFYATNTVNVLLDTIYTAGSYVNLTESSATIFTKTTIANSKIQGGSILVTVEANDATDYQSRTLRFIWSAVNKAGTLTITLSTPEEVVAVSAGTLTATITATDDGSGVLSFKANAVSSLTQTTLRATYQTFKNF